MILPFKQNKNLLPKNFHFPATYLKFMTSQPLPDLTPWHFLCMSPPDADDWLLAIKDLYPDRKLVPFALWEDSDDIVCFDADTPSKDPLIYCIHAYASPGWEERGRIINFTEWLRLAREDSEEYKMEQEE